jgi:putative SOS response-associated peptidase YedK
MCVNYLTISRQIAFDWFRTPIEASDDWRDELFRDFTAPFIVHDDNGQRKGMIGSYGFVPQRHRPYKPLTEQEKLSLAAGQEVKRKRIPLDTMNARAEDVGSKLNYKRFWREQQLCIVPAMAVFEPNWETGVHERWCIALANGEPFGLPGMWRSWEGADGTLAHSFSHFTPNADHHPLLRRFHSDKEKRGVAILRPEDYDDWLGSSNPEFARALLQLYPAELLHAEPAPKPPDSRPTRQDNATASQPDAQLDLF